MHLRKHLLIATLLLLLTPMSSIAQVSSAAITGAVKDTTGAVVPHVTVTAIEQSTGVVTNATTNDVGEYTFPFLKPGRYNISVGVKGFKHYEQKGMALSVGDHPTVDIKLEVGGSADVIEVTAEPPLLGTQDANIGQVITRQIIDTIPLSGRAPMNLALYSEGVVFTSNPVVTRPVDNSALAAFSVGGLPNKDSEILIDGSPDTASDNSVAFSPPMDAVQEFTLKVFASDATYGHAGGAVANQVTKSGTNKFHGTLSEYHTDNDLDANGFFNKRQGTKPPVSRQNQFGGTIGGPVIIPKLYNGKDKMFFFFAYEGFYDSYSAQLYSQVPTDAERKGDFSILLSPGNNGYPRFDQECGSGKNIVYSNTYNTDQLYDPTTGVLNQACKAQGFIVYDRQPFANDIITSGSLPLSKVAQNVVKYFPEPTNPYAYLGYLNYETNYPVGDKYNDELGRVDYVLSPRQKIYLTGRHSKRYQYENQIFGFTNPTIGDFLYRYNWGASAGDIVQFSPSLLGELRVNYTRFSQPITTAGDGFDPATLGLPNLASAHKMFPHFNFNDYGFQNGTQQSLGVTSQTSGTAPYNNDDVFLDFIKIKGLHTVKFGVDFRKMQKGNFTYGNSSGIYNFDNGFTSPFGGDAYQGYEQDFAAFMLGLPSNWQPALLNNLNPPPGSQSSASYDYPVKAVGNQTYLALFVQDDWRVTPQLTLNAGLRMEKDFSPNEREGTTVNGFDTTTINPYNAAVTAAYAANPNSVLPVANFKLVGGLTFNSPSNKIFSVFPSVMFSPRFGFAYTPKLVKDTVVRGGFGIFVLPNLPFNNTINQDGFSQTTLSPTTPFAPPTAGGPGTLDNPFPNGLALPTGSSQGLGTFAGGAISFLAPVIRNAYAERWHIGFQHQFAHSWMADAFYEGSTGRRLPINENLDYIQRQYLTTATNLGYNAHVVNPFYGLIPNGGVLNNSTTIQLSQLLMTYPQFTSVTEQNVPAGSSIFHAFDFHIEHRMGYGLSMFANYQWSKVLEAVTFLNASDPRPEYRIGQYDHPTRVTAVVSDELPYGRGRHFGANAPRWLDLPIGGWNLTSVWFYQQGSPLTFPDLTPTGQPLNWHPRQATENGGGYSTIPAFNINAFVNYYTPNQVQPQNEIRTFPSQYSIYRYDAYNQWDASLAKNFNISKHGGTYFQLRLDAFNVNNRPVFSGPVLSGSSGAFGQILGQGNASRSLLVGAKINF